MGALWKGREYLKGELGAAAGAATSNALFLAWMNAYDDGTITPLIETHWLVLDDDDGNIWNGTPHWNQIDQGFRDQGWPGIGIGLSEAYVDAAWHFEPQLGTLAAPFDSLDTAQHMLQRGGRVVLRSSVDEVLVLDKPMVIESSGSSASIGD